MLRRTSLRACAHVMGLLLLSGCQGPTPETDGFGDGCDVTETCADGLLCFEGTCVPDDVPPPVSDVDTSFGEEDGIPGCLAILLDQPEAAVCEGRVIVGDYLSNDLELPYDPIALEELAGCEVFDGEIVISSPAVSDLAALSSLSAVCGDLKITGNPNLTSLAGLESLTWVTGTLWVAGGVAGFSLSGLESLRGVGWLHASADTPLDHHPLDALEHARRLELRSVGPTGVEGLANLRTVDRLTLGGETMTTLAGLPVDLVIKERLSIFTSYELDSLLGLGPTELPPELHIRWGPTLASLTDLRALRGDAVHTLLLDALPQLQNVQGLDALPALTTLKLQSLESLTSLAGAEHLEQLDELSLTHLHALSDLAGLESLTSVGTVEITSNDLLCADVVEAFQQAVSLQDASIWGNGSHCQ